MKKRIGISETRTNFANYPAWFTKEDLGDDIELIILSFLKNNTDDISKCDGFVLTGGVDIQPSYYGGEVNYENQPPDFQPARDAFEKKIYEFAKENQLPVLGICRGMQLVNVLEGGSLIQDLGVEGNERHKAAPADKQHAVNIAPGSLLHNIAGKTNGQVNSAHHQAIDENTISVQLQPNAWSADDPYIIEGLEYKDKSGKPFLLCVQWHPERIPGKEQNPLSQNIKEQFMAAVKNSKR
jgi:putative glutamine amidotransferase